MESIIDLMHFLLPIISSSIMIVDVFEGVAWLRRRVEPVLHIRTVSGNGRLFAGGVDRGEVRYVLTEYVGARKVPAEGSVRSQRRDALPSGIASATLRGAQGAAISLEIRSLHADTGGWTALVHAESELPDSISGTRAHPVAARAGAAADLSTAPA